MSLYTWSQKTAQFGRTFPPTYWYLWLGILLNKLGEFVIPFLTIYLTETRHLSAGQATSIIGLVGFGSFISRPIGGFLADKIGCHRTILLSLSCTTVTTLILGFAYESWLIVNVAFLLGFFNGLFGPASTAMIAGVVNDEMRIRAYGLTYWAVNVGASVAPLLAGFLASYNYLALFLLDALTTGSFAFLVWWRIPKVSPGRTNHEQRKSFKGTIKVLRNEPLLFVLTALTFGFNCIWFQAYSALPLDMHSHGLTNAEYGAALAMNGLVVIVLSIPLNHLLKRFPHAYVLAGASFMLALGFGLTIFASNLWFYAFTIVLWSIGEIAAVPLTTAIIADLSPPHSRGIFQGILGAALGLASFAGPILGGLIIEHLGTRVLWLSCFIFGNILVLGYLTLRQMRER